MKHDAVIGAFARQFLDAGDMARRHFRKKLDDHLALGGLEDDSVFRILDLGHVTLLISGFLARFSFCRR
ncbi:hypothetical protein D3C87_2132650 [compost metagenome]